MRIYSLLLSFALTACTHSYNLKQTKEVPSFRLPYESPMRIIVTYGSNDFTDTDYRPIELVKTRIGFLGHPKVKIGEFVSPTELHFYNRYSLGKKSQHTAYSQTFADTKEFANYERKNCILVRIRSNVNKQESVPLLTTLTLAILPSYVDADYEVQVQIYDSNGKFETKKFKLKQMRRIWFGWVFFFWGEWKSDNQAKFLNEILLQSLHKLAK
ncbi:MAG: hypothetical protein AAF518_03135 [Spirochaetota bacterium]